VVPEAPLKKTENGLVPAGEGWFVVNLADARWMSGRFGAYTDLEGSTRWPQVGVNVGVLQPGEAACFYHREADQEDFLILRGEALLVVEGGERPLRAWDFVHTPAWSEHVFVGAGDGPCAILAIGARDDRGVVYPVADVALRRDAGVRRETTLPREPTRASRRMSPPCSTPAGCRAEPLTCAAWRAPARMATGEPRRQR
jgi:uncharacterized cupin superfamily protein